MTMDQINVRIDAKIKAEAVLSKIGLAPSDVIRMLYHQVIMRQGLPFVPRVEEPAVKGKEKDREKMKAAIKKSIEKNKVALMNLADR
jgi:addiction module RelB/DinJ family antitoxin